MTGDMNQAAGSDQHVKVNMDEKKIRYSALTRTFLYKY